MKLIIGQALSVDNSTSNDFNELGRTLGELGLGSETLDCALVYLLKLSDSFSRVDQSILKEFMAACKDSAKTHTQTG